MKLILVGGFLGAGKTRLMKEAAHCLLKKGFRVGLITNDQAASLVDTSFLLHEGFVVKEVHGSCFCCDFGGFMNAIEELRRELNPEVIIAEPVGSCTDLSATLLQPIKELYRETIEISPLSVLIDPKRLKDLLDKQETGLHQDAVYIIQKQLEEADLIVVSKSDLLPFSECESLIDQTARKFLNRGVIALSAHSGEGIQGWVESMMASNEGGRYLAEIDYDIYARGEAVLGWLNATIDLTGEGVNWNRFSTLFLKEFDKALKLKEARVGHAKLILERGDSYLRGNLTGTSQEHEWEGGVEEGGAVKLTLNLRVQMLPEELQACAKDVLYSVSDKIQFNNQSWNCFSPGRPNPSHRYSQIKN